MLPPQRRGALGSQGSVDNGRSNAGGTRSVTHEYLGRDDGGSRLDQATRAATRTIDSTGKEETV